MKTTSIQMQSRKFLTKFHVIDTLRSYCMLTPIFQLEYNKGCTCEMTTVQKALNKPVQMKAGKTIDMVGDSMAQVLLHLLGPF